MKPDSAIAGILTLLASLFTITSSVFAQSTIKDTTAHKLRVSQFDFESVAKRLTGLSEPTITLPQRDSLPKRLHDKVVHDLSNTHGHLDLSYAYGLNTVFIDTSRSVGSIFNTSGDFRTAIIGLPVNVSFNYSTLKVPLGANNYFRISLDKNRLIEQQKQKLTASITNIENQEALLQKKQAQLNGLMGYVEVYMDQLKRLAAREAEKRKTNVIRGAQDTVSGVRPNLSDSLKNKDYKTLDLNNSMDYQLYYDSVIKVYNRISSLKNSCDSLSDKLTASRELYSANLAQLNSPDKLNKNLPKVSLLQSIQTLDIGLTYPKTTAMSGQNVPLKGLHVEIQNRNYYLSLATGLTLNNLMLSTNEIQNQLNYSQNVFNNFDFQQVMNNGWLTAIKTGYGTPDGTHAYIGFNYLTNTRFLNPAGTLGTKDVYDPAASFELDFRYVPSFLKGSAFDLVYGKTSINKRLDTVTDSGVFQSVFSAYPSNLLLAKYTQSLPKIRSDFSVSYRRIDTYVNTTTFGMMQPNNQRLEVKTTHNLAKFMKLGLLYRVEETLRTLAMMRAVRLNVSGLNLSGSYTSYFNYSFHINHIHHRMSLPVSLAVQKGNNYLVGVTMGSNYQIGKADGNTVISYNDYLITDSSKVNKYTQFGLIQSFGDRMYSAAASYDYFYRRIDGLSSGTSVFGLSGKYSLKKVKLGAGLKLAIDRLEPASLGGHLEVLWQAHKKLDVGIRAERFVLGNFYRNYYRTQYEQFPYLITIQTSFKI